MATRLDGFRCIVTTYDEDSGRNEFEILPPLDLPAVLMILEWSRWKARQDILANGPGNIGFL